MHALASSPRPLRRLVQSVALVFCKMAAIHFDAPWRQEARRC